MDMNPTPKEISEETCSHDWKMEPAWRLVSLGHCRKCKASTTALNNPEPDPAVKKRSLRRNKRRVTRDKANDLTKPDGGTFHQLDRNLRGG